MKEMEKKLHEMEKKLHEMKNKLDKLEHLEAYLLIGEIASREEREMAKHILKDFPEINKSYITFNQIDMTINGTSQCPSIKLSQE